MAKVRKRTLRSGETRWLADYFDSQGKRRFKQFTKRRDADDYLVRVRGDLQKGIHVAPAASITVADAGSLWLASGEEAHLERSTLDQYRQHVDLHIVPLIGKVVLSNLNAPAVRSFEDRLRTDGRSSAMVRKIMVSLGSLLADAQEHGLVAINAVRDLRRTRRKGKERQAERRQKGKLKIGVDIPTRAEIKAIVDNASGRWRPLLITAIFTGLRASELRGLKWADVDFAKRELHVRQRADRFNTIGPPKTEAGERTVPLPPLALNTLKEWKLACPISMLGLVFPNGAGNVEALANIINRGLIPVQNTGKVTDEGKAKYTGMHALRHFYASWCINRRVDGGLELPAKIVQERLGHSSIVVTMDVYGHLFPRLDDSAELATAEASLLA